MAEISSPKTHNLGKFMENNDPKNTNSTKSEDNTSIQLPPVASPSPHSQQFPYPQQHQQQNQEHHQMQVQQLPPPPLGFYQVQGQAQAYPIPYYAEQWSPKPYLQRQPDGGAGMVMTAGPAVIQQDPNYQLPPMHQLQQQQQQQQQQQAPPLQQPPQHSPQTSVHQQPQTQAQQPSQAQAQNQTHQQQQQHQHQPQSAPPQQQQHQHQPQVAPPQQQPQQQHHQQPQGVSQGGPQSNSAQQHPQQSVDPMFNPDAYYAPPYSSDSSYSAYTTNGANGYSFGYEPPVLNRNMSYPMITDRHQSLPSQIIHYDSLANNGTALQSVGLPSNGLINAGPTSGPPLDPIPAAPASRARKHKRRNTDPNYSSSGMTPETAARNRCPKCQKQFKRPSSLQTHLYSHTGEKPFKCQWDGCGRNFSVRSNMTRHMKLHERDYNNQKTAVNGTSTTTTVNQMSSGAISYNNSAPASNGYKYLGQTGTLGHQTSSAPTSASALSYSPAFSNGTGTPLLAGGSMSAGIDPNSKM